MISRGRSARKILEDCRTRTDAPGRRRRAQAGWRAIFLHSLSGWRAVASWRALLRRRTRSFKSKGTRAEKHSESKGSQSSLLGRMWSDEASSKQAKPAIYPAGRPKRSCCVLCSCSFVKQNNALLVHSRRCKNWHPSMDPALPSCHNQGERSVFCSRNEELLRAARKQRTKTTGAVWATRSAAAGVMTIQQPLLHSNKRLLRRNNLPK